VVVAEARTKQAVRTIVEAEEERNYSQRMGRWGAIVWSQLMCTAVAKGQPIMDMPVRNEYNLDTGAGDKFNRIPTSSLLVKQCLKCPMYWPWLA
jgi:hypothetical protein